MEALVEQLVKKVSSNAPIRRGDLGTPAGRSSVSDTLEEEPSPNPGIPTPESQVTADSSRYLTIYDHPKVRSLQCLSFLSSLMLIVRRGAWNMKLLMRQGVIEAHHLYRLLTLITQ